MQFGFPAYYIEFRAPQQKRKVVKKWTSKQRTRLWELHCTCAMRRFPRQQNFESRPSRYSCHNRTSCISSHVHSRSSCDHVPCMCVLSFEWRPWSTDTFSLTSSLAWFPAVIGSVQNYETIDGQLLACHRYVFSRYESESTRVCLAPPTTTTVPQARSRRYTPPRNHNVHVQQGDNVKTSFYAVQSFASLFLSLQYLTGSPFPILAVHSLLGEKS